MSDPAPTLIEVALNGITSKEQNPSVPREPSEIVADALRSFEAGAAIVHTHIDDFALSPEAAAARYLEAYEPIVAARPDAILYPTIGGGSSVAERYGHHEILARSGTIRAGVLDPGSVNLGDPANLAFTGDFSISATFRIDSYPSRLRRMIVFRGDNRSGTDPYFLGIEQNGFLDFAIVDESPLASIVRAPDPIQLGVLYDVLANLDDTTGEQKLYLDGVLVASRITSIRPFATLNPDGAVAIGSTNIGRQNWHGVIDNVQFDNMVREPRPVPEPVTLALVALGTGVVFWRRKRKSAT